MHCQEAVLQSRQENEAISTNVRGDSGEQGADSRRFDESFEFHSRLHIRVYLWCIWNYRYPVPQRGETHGRSEEYLGRWIRERKVPRDRVVDATKFAETGNRLH